MHRPPKTKSLPHALNSALKILTRGRGNNTGAAHRSGETHWAYKLGMTMTPETEEWRSDKEGAGERLVEPSCGPSTTGVHDDTLWLYCLS